MTMPAEQLFIEEADAAAAPDLCTTCLHLDDCVYSRTGREAVLECEFFATEGATEVREAPALVTEPEPEPLAGLCANCDHRADCTLPRPAAGVWHCEEYA